MKPNHGERRLLARFPRGRKRRSAWETIGNQLQKGDFWFVVEHDEWRKIRNDPVKILQKLMAECR